MLDKVYAYEKPSVRFWRKRMIWWPTTRTGGRPTFVVPTATTRRRGSGGGDGTLTIENSLPAGDVVRFCRRLHEPDAHSVRELFAAIKYTRQNATELLLSDSTRARRSNRRT
jgi:hypothetical protein